MLDVKEVMNAHLTHVSLPSFLLVDMVKETYDAMQMMIHSHLSKVSRSIGKPDSFIQPAKLPHFLLRNANIAICFHKLGP